MTRPIEASGSFLRGVRSGVSRDPLSDSSLAARMSGVGDNCRKRGPVIGFARPFIRLRVRADRVILPHAAIGLTDGIESTGENIGFQSKLRPGALSQGRASILQRSGIESGLHVQPSKAPTFAETPGVAAASGNPELPDAFGDPLKCAVLPDDFSEFPSNGAPPTTGSRP